MAKRQTDVEIHAEDVEKEDVLDVSVDLVDDGLYLGNLACAREIKTLEALKITHILTIDVVPLPRSMLDRANIHFEYLKLWDATCVDTLAPSHLHRTSIRAAAAAEMAETAKAGKYSGLGAEYDFVPFGVETLGLWGPGALSLFKDLSKRLRDTTGDRRAGSFLAQRISLAIQRGNAASIFVADVPKEDLISHLPETNEYIKKAITEGGVVLVHWFMQVVGPCARSARIATTILLANPAVKQQRLHCCFGVENKTAGRITGTYFGVSRSAAVVIAYIMEKYSLCYEEAFNLVKNKRRFISPNVGFVAQLKLFGHMGYKIDREDPRFKQFRLKLAGQKLKQVKILPQLFADLIKPDPGLVRERPDPVVYRCRKCRRVVASQRNIIPHVPKQIKMEMAKKGIRPPPSKLTGLHCAENGQILIEKLKSLACQIIDGGESPGQSQSDTGTEEGPIQVVGPCASSARIATTIFIANPAVKQQCLHCCVSAWRLDGYSEQNLVDGSIAARGAAACRLMWFVEPMAWMRRVALDPHGKLHCPKCNHKIGSFSWVCGCKCPCGQKVAPAFYLVPSKVEWSNIVQNVQVTV
ncbi:hypothetical protein MSG28_000037 [Choristoneura fumiferana]|uniref:Uncharacterized protein n=1 Tax=Choristoneura fumiferana TaxID=7141 RepID=A0ACC0JYZ4_CHOFU|nr:hypothetical protein MSG28_000037 [Choristoneura fumiferana]